MDNMHDVSEFQLTFTQIQTTRKFGYENYLKKKEVESHVVYISLNEQMETINKLL